MRRRVNKEDKPRRILGIIGEDGLDDNDGNGFGIMWMPFCKTFFGKDWDGPRHLKRKVGYYGRNGRLELLMKEIAKGAHCNEAAKKSNSGPHTAAAIRKILVHLKGEIYCKCGRPANHKCWCSVRYKRNKKMQRAWAQAVDRTRVLTKEDVIEARKLYATWKYSLVELGDKFGVTDVCIQNAINGATWSNIPGAVKETRPRDWQHRYRGGGVSFNKQKGKWDAYLHMNGKKTNLGRFMTEQEAIKVRDEARNKIAPNVS